MVKGKKMTEKPPAPPAIRITPNTNSINDQYRLRFARIASGQIESENVINEIRSLIFRVPLNEMENETRIICEKLLVAALRTNEIHTKEIEKYRLEILNLLSLLNFKFNNTIPIDKMCAFFKYISDGSITDLSGALPIIKQTFEVADVFNRQYLTEIANLTITSCTARMAWLLQHYDQIDYNYFPPFLTLLTIISFCSKSFEPLKDKFLPIYHSMEEFILKDLPKNKSDYSIIALLALKARTIHCYLLYVEKYMKNKSLISLIDSNLLLLRHCPPSFHTLHEEIAWSFFYFLSQERVKDPVILLKFIETLPKLISFSHVDPEFFMSQQTVAYKLFDIILPSPKCDWAIINLYIRFSIECLFFDSSIPLQRLKRFMKAVSVLLNKFKEMPPPNCKYHFNLIFAVHQFIRYIDLNVKKMLLTANFHSQDFNDVQQTIYNVQFNFDMISIIIEFLSIIFDSLSECRVLIEKHKFPFFPYTQIEVEYTHQVFIDLIFLIIDARELSGKCNFRFASQSITSNAPKNSEMCVTHIKLSKYLEKVRQTMNSTYNHLPKVLKKWYPQMFLQNLFNKFLEQLFQKKDKLITRSNILHTFASDLPSFYILLSCLLQLSIEELTESEKGSTVINTTTLVIEFLLKKLNSQNEIRFDPKDRAINILHKKITQVVGFFHSRIESILNIDDAIYFIIQVMSLFIALFKQPGKIPELLSLRLIEKIIIAANQREIGDSLLAFFEFANKYAPKNIEYPQVVDTLIRSHHGSIKSLLLIYQISQRNKKAVYNDFDKMRRLLFVTLNALPRATNEEKIILLKIIKKLPLARSIDSSESGLKPRFLMKDRNSKYEIEIPANDLIVSCVASIQKSPNDPSLWNKAKLFVSFVFLNHDLASESNYLGDEDLLSNSQENTELHYFSGFQNDIYNQKFVNSLIPLIHINIEKALNFFLYFSKNSLVFLAHFLISLVVTNKILTDTQSSHFFSIIDSKEKFKIVINNIVKFSSLSYSNVNGIQKNLAISLAKYVSVENIDSIALSLFVVQIITTKYSYKRTQSNQGNKFKFFELEILPKDIQDLFHKTKQILQTNISNNDSLNRKPELIFLKNISESNFKLTRCLYGELASVCLTQEEMNEFLNIKVQEMYQTNIFQLMKIASIIFRIYPGIISVHIDKVDSFLNKYAVLSSDGSNTDKEKQQYVIEVLYSIAPSFPAYFEKYENFFFEMFINMQEYPLFTYIPLLKSLHNVMPDHLTQRLKDYFLQKLRDDGVDSFFTWDELQTSKLSVRKWESVLLYFPFLFILVPSYSIPTALRYLIELIKVCSDQGYELFHKIYGLFVNEETICYLVSENKYSVYMSILLQGLKSYNLMINHTDLEYLIDSIAFANDAGIRFLHSAIKNEKYCAFIQIAFKEEHSKHLKEIVFSDIEFIQSNLKVGTTTATDALHHINQNIQKQITSPQSLQQLQQHLQSNQMLQLLSSTAQQSILANQFSKSAASEWQYSFAASALSYENILNNIELYNIIFDFFTHHLPSKGNLLVYTDLFIKFILNNILDIDRKDVITALTSFFNSNSQIVISMASELIEEIVKSGSRFRINELITANLISHDISFLYLKCVIIPFIKNQNCSPLDFLSLYNFSKIDPNSNHLRNLPIMTHLLHLHAYLILLHEISTFHITFQKSYELFKSCENDEEKYIVFEIWSLSKDDEFSHFDEVFRSFLNGISVYLSSHQKKACENLRLPKRIPKSLLNEFLRIIVAFQKSQLILISLWTILSKNLHIVNNNLTAFWPVLSLQILNLRQLAKKTQIIYTISLISVIAQVLSPYSSADMIDHHVIANFADFVMQMLKLLIDQQQPHLKLIPSLTSSALKLLKHFGSRVSIVNTYFKYLFDFYQKNPKQSMDVFLYLIHFLPEMIEHSILNDDTIDFEPVCDMLFAIAINQSSPAWPSAYAGISILLENKRCISKIHSLIANIPNDEIWIRFASILWKVDFPEQQELRMSKLLPFARKVFNLENSDNSTHKFMLTCLLVTIFNNPYSDAVQLLMQDLKVKNAYFRTFFLKYFVNLFDMKSHIITSIGNILKTEKITLDNMELANPKLKAYLSVKTKKENKILKEFNDSLKEKSYKKLKSWEIAYNLPEFIRNDYMDSLEPFSAIKTNIRHNLHISIMNSFSSDIENINSDYLDSITDCFENINSGDISLQNVISELTLNPITIYNTNFAKFYLICSAQKKKNPYSRPLSPFFSPFIHNSMLKFLNKIRVTDMKVHNSKFHKSLQYSFCEQRPARPSLDQLCEINIKSLHNLLLSLSSQAGNPEWTQIIFTSIQQGLKLQHRDVIFLSSLFKILPYIPPEKFELPIKQLDPFWSSFMVEFILKHNITSKNYLTLLHSSVFISLLNPIATSSDENNPPNKICLPEIIKYPISILEEIILQRGYLNIIDFLIEIPFANADKAGFVCPLNDESLIIRGKSGILYKYLLTPSRPMNSMFTLANYCINYYFRKFLNTRERGITLPYIQSLPIKNNMFLSSTEFIRFSGLKKEQIMSKKENILWRTLLSEKLGALSALNILLNGDFDINTVLIDEKNSMLTFQNIIQGEKIRLPIFCDSSMLNGPFKNGVIAAFLNFSFYRDEIRHLLSLGFNVEELDQKISEYSIPESSAESVHSKIQHLIDLTLEDDTIQSSSWL